MEYLRFIISFIISFVINLFGRKRPQNVGNILIVRLDHIGDMACSLEAIKNVRDNFPSSKIILITGDWNAKIFSDQILVNEVIIYNSPTFTRNKYSYTTLSRRFKLFIKLRRVKHTIIISFRDDLFTLFLSLFLFPQKRVDRGTVRLKMKLLSIYSTLVKRYKSVPAHEIETNKAIVKPIIQTYRGTNDFFRFNNEEMLWLKSFLNDEGLSYKRYAVFHPGASWPYRRWPIENFLEVGKFLNEKFNIMVLVVGAPDEEKLGSFLENSFNDIFINVIGKTNLRQLVLLINFAQIMVCNDSGPMHISAALGTPTFALLGPQQIERFGPKGKNVYYFHKSVECYPCDQTICKYPQNPCVNLNTVTEIKSKIQSYFVPQKDINN